MSWSIDRQTSIFFALTCGGFSEWYPAKSQSIQRALSLFFIASTLII
ncbi:hypothetical protein QWZ16_17700 [Vibrio ostreicida]|uniref:DUF3265 domain-containing protein n=1 Tax=Vibrio ostreicida TaxID=526588 RepID=A0ABT8BZB0_9VIBR|nr:hypothetical protein [Vibrio ostreicida]MDN3611437.1 hypothetical protein [Vibrio ostreicida]